MLGRPVVDLGTGLEREKSPVAYFSEVCEALHASFPVRKVDGWEVGEGDVVACYN